MEKIKEFFKNRNNLKNLILLIELVLIILLLVKCINLQKKVDKYEEKLNEITVQKIKLPELEELDGNND